MVKQRGRQRMLQRHNGRSVSSKNSLERAFLAGANFSEERIKELEKVIEKIRLISERSYKLPVTSVAAMKNLKIINKRAVQALKGGD